MIIHEHHANRRALLLGVGYPAFRPFASFSRRVGCLIQHAALSHCLPEILLDLCDFLCPLVLSEQ